MPTYEYVCADRHVTTRAVPLAKAPGPKAIKCERKTCGLRAKRRTTYAVHVNGGPTRGSF